MAAFDDLRLVVGDLADEVVRALLPKVEALVRSGAEAATPTIRKIVQEEVAPRAVLYGVGGLLAVGAVAAWIGSWMATRGRSAGISFRNPILPLRLRRRSA